nr:AT-rich interactive domain-containing protein 3A isoform X2 [Halyomorpha halys]
MEMDHRDSDIEGTIPHQGCREMYFLDKKSTIFTQSTAELSETEEDSREAGRPAVDNGIADQTVNIIKQERDESKVAAAGPPTFTLPFPFPHPFIQPAPAPFPPVVTTQPAVHSSASSHSSESSSGSQQTWSFEEQFKQVMWSAFQTPQNYVKSAAGSQVVWSAFQPPQHIIRIAGGSQQVPGPSYQLPESINRLNGNGSLETIKLYEISDDPKRKEFLDDLFSFMQRRGTPINRLPIMAKSVLDLYELYNLVIQRGGLVDVINKKLWQEIIKGLHLPSSITSAAFTLRTQYMKYLYPYECEKRRLSTPGELQAAIDGNRREGRRGSYGTYAEMMQRSPTQSSPLSLVTGGHSGRSVSVNGTGNHHHHHHNNNHIPPHQALMPPSVSGSGGITSDIEYRMVEYVKMLNKEFRTSATPPIPKLNSPPGSPSEGTAVNMNPLEMSRLTLWNIYNNAAPQETQREALNLEKREDPLPPPPKRHYPDNDDLHISNTHIKIARENKGGDSENSLVVSMDINGIVYQGVLFAQNAHSNRVQS